MIKVQLVLTQISKRWQHYSKHTLSHHNEFSVGLQYTRQAKTNQASTVSE